MKNKVYGRPFLPILAVFLVSSGLIQLGASVLGEWKTDSGVLQADNGLFFGLTLISYLLHIKSLRSQNPHLFVRMIYSSLIIKMMVCMVAALLYGWLTKTVNRNAILGCFILYVVYTFLEVRVLMKFIKKSPNNA
jgi:hypothetical protein